VTISIIKNAPVRRDKADIKVKEFVSDIKQLSSRYSAAVASSSPNSMAVWEAIKQWDETQVGWNLPTAHATCCLISCCRFHSSSALIRAPPGSLERLFYVVLPTSGHCVSLRSRLQNVSRTAGLAGYETPRLASPAVQLNAW
jgi:hypothetical protein